MYFVVKVVDLLLKYNKIVFFSVLVYIFLLFKLLLFNGNLIILLCLKYL